MIDPAFYYDSDADPPAPADPLPDKDPSSEFGEIVAVVIRFVDVDPLVIICMDPGVAPAMRELYPDAAIWTAPAFKRLVDDIKHLMGRGGAELFSALQLIKGKFGGQYEGLIIK